eukprot:TRINITY_DN103602_c0_g1_i1.p1 TRINITY_DN103602_c0_g1~~TRINITY_DN103602_c0_g1_i1.p1  ORF type:complete len:704 (-),score=87.48 TRINITY_DN103602_c0_g1_i1:7-2118(-)
MSLAASIGKKIAVHHQLITSATFLAGLIVVLIFPSFDRRTEVEEHALIPGYADSGFGGDWQSRLRQCVQQIETETSIQYALNKALLDAGLQAYHMNFTTSGGVQSSLTYTLAHSRRGDSREAVVLVVGTNWTAGGRPTAKVSWGLATGVVLAEYLRSVHWLSKDVFVVFVDSSLAYGAGARAWLRAYFGGYSEVRRGVLRQAVVLQMKNGASSLLLDVEGVNGMVPNQDIVNSYTVSAGERPGMQIFHREPWDSVFHTFKNGGVHSSHAPFLELQVPAFTIRGQRTKSDKRAGRPALNIDLLAMSLEGVIRCMSNNLQQLHHSFNFYFFTGSRSHISNGLYLYPVFAMQLPLISFLTTIPAYRDIQSLLLGLATIVAMSGVSGSVIFMLGTSRALVLKLHQLLPWLQGLSLAETPTCIRPETIDQDELGRRRAAASWLLAGLAAALMTGLAFRRYAFTVFSGKIDETKEQGAVRSSGVRLPCPLWEAVRAASGFAFLAVLAPVTIYSWALAMPLTVVSVPVLVLARPFSLRQRPLRSLLLLGFLAGNAFLLAVPSPQRAELLGNGPGQVAASIFEFYDRSLLPALPREAQKFFPTQFMGWLRQGQLADALSSDLLVGLYEAARDFNCVGGMLFPIFCFAYWPLLMLLLLIGGMLPAQRVDDEGVTLAQLRMIVLMVLSLVLAGVVGGVVWRSYSSHGLGQLQW